MTAQTLPSSVADPAVTVLVTPDAVAAVAERAALAVACVVRLEEGLAQDVAAAAAGVDLPPALRRTADVSVASGVASIDLRVIVSQDCDRLLRCVELVQDAVKESVLEVTGLTAVVSVLVWALAA